MIGVVVLACAAGGRLSVTGMSSSTTSTPTDLPSAPPTTPTIPHVLPVGPGDVVWETLDGAETEEIGVDGHPDDVWNDFLFDDDLEIYDVGLSADAIASLMAAPYEWVSASLDFEGIHYEPVGVRCKGENSFLPITQKCSLKFDFDRFAELDFFGLEELTLNNMSNDSSMMHERVAYRMFREAGVPAARASHAQVWFNHVPWGLYAVVETVHINMAERWFDDTTGSMYEVHDVDFFDVYVPLFSHEFGPDDRTAIQGTADVLELLNGDEAIAALEPYMNHSSFLDYWAVTAIVGQYDSYPYGYPGDDTHVYDDPIGGNLVWLPHGVDETFYDEYRSPLVVNGEVAKVCLESAACTEDLISRMWVAQELSEEIDLLAYAEFVKAQIEELVDLDTHKPYDSASVYAEQDEMLKFISKRAVDLEGTIGPP